MAEKLIIELDLETGDVNTAFDKIEQKSKKSGKKSGTNFGSTFSGAVSSFLGNVGAVAFNKAVGGIKNQIFEVVNAAKKLELIENQFATILGSTEAAQKQLQDLQNFAATTPFQIEGLALSTRQLISFGLEQEKVIPTLRQLGDLAAATGVQITELTIPFGRLISTQRLSLIELDKFADRGINLYGKLAQQTGIALGDIRKAIEKGKVPFGEFTKALDELTGKGGIFFNATSKQAKTLSGLLTTLGDNVEITRSNFGRLFTPLIVAGVKSLTSGFQALNEAIKGVTVKDVIQNLVGFNDAVITYLIAPLEVFLNASTVIFDIFVNGINGIVASLGFLGGKFAELIEFLGGDAPQGLKDFADTTAEVFEESSLKVGESFNKIFEFPISDKLAMANQELGTGLEETNSILENNAKKTEATVQKTGKAISKVAQNTQKIINNALVRGISGGIQNIAQSLAKGESIFDNFGKFVLGAIGDLAITLGEFFIAEGIATQALIAVNPPSATIAAGVGLVALGSIIKSFAGGGGSSSGSATSAGGGSATSAGGIQPVEFVDNENLNTEPQTNVNVTIQGDVLDSEESGTRIAEILSESFGKQGVVLADARFV